MTATVDHLTAVGAAITSGAIVARYYAHEWWVVKPSRVGEVLHLLPEDPCRDWDIEPEDTDRLLCLHRGPTAWPCARRKRHLRRHAAIEHGHIVAVWGTR